MNFQLNHMIEKEVSTLKVFLAPYVKWANLLLTVKPTDVLEENLLLKFWNICR